jgi:hypothetical protein
MKLVFDEKTNSYQYQTVEDAPVASMEKNNIISSIDKAASFDIAGIPIGSAIIGGTAAILLDRVVLERIDPTHKYGPAAMLVGALGMGWVGKKYHSKAAEATALILAYEGIADYISMIVDKVWPVAATTQNSVVRQATAVARQVGSTGTDYYKAAFGR